MIAKEVSVVFKKLIHIKNYGRFSYFCSKNSDWDGSFKKINVIYAPNGSGKTTLGWDAPAGDAFNSKWPSVFYQKAIFHINLLLAVWDRCVHLIFHPVFCTLLPFAEPVSTDDSSLLSLTHCSCPKYVGS